MKISKTKAAVIGFTLAIIALFSCEEAHAETRVHLGISQGILQSEDQIAQVLGITHADRWGIDYSRIGNQSDDGTNAIAVYRKVYANKGRLRWFLELGAAYFDNKIRKESGTPFVDEYFTYHLGVGGSYELSEITRIQLKIKHNSVAGRVEDNTGIDHVELTFHWRV